MEALIGGRRRVGGNLLVRTLAPDWKQIDLGVILDGGYNQDSGYDFRTEQGWFHIEYNEELSIMLDDHVGWMGIDCRTDEIPGQAGDDMAVKPAMT